MNSRARFVVCLLYHNVSFSWKVRLQLEQSCAFVVVIYTIRIADARGRGKFANVERRPPRDLQRISFNVYM